MAVRVSPEEFASKWKNHLDNAEADIIAGVDRVTVAPGVAAAAASDKFIRKITESVNDGTWQKAVAGVSLADWQKAMKEKGVGRIRQGTASAQGKMADFASKLFPAIERAQAKVAALPSMTFEDNLNRAAEFMREMHRFNYKGVS